MMLRQVFLVFSFYLISKINALESNNFASKGLDINPLANKDEAQALLHDLQQLILGNILAAHEQLEDLRLAMLTQRTNVRLEAEVDIEEEVQTLDGQLTSLKDLGIAAGQNISTCFLLPEVTVAELPTYYRRQIQDCIDATEINSNLTLEVSYYSIDIHFNTVQSLNFTLIQCSGADTDCIDAVVERIKKTSEDVPLQIEVELFNAGANLDNIKVTIKECADTNLVLLILQGGVIISDVTDCVNDLLS